jgi:hypothetical protein
VRVPRNALERRPSTGTIEVAAQLPDDIGIDATADAQDVLYFFNGPGGNIVSSWDPETGVFTAAVPSLDGPSGTYVTGLAF